MPVEVSNINVSASSEIVVKVYVRFNGYVCDVVKVRLDKVIASIISESNRLENITVFFVSVGELKMSNCDLY